LGPKLAGGEYTQDDKELLYTLLNNLAVAVKNAKSFEEIRRSTRTLKRKTSNSAKTLQELRESLRKIEILEKVKTNLCKFIPATVSRLIDKSPTGTIPELEERDLSVLFLDIEGYTGLCERLGDSAVHDIIERHFSVFMDAIYRNNGDVNETAGDGLMVLFMHEDPETSALEAVRAALSIKEQTVKISEQFTQLYRPLDVNIGINSGRALVGAAKFESITGSRWTYTARGTLTNVAARISALGSKGTILISRRPQTGSRPTTAPPAGGNSSSRTSPKKWKSSSCKTSSRFYLTQSMQGSLRNAQKQQHPLLSKGTFLTSHLCYIIM
jgi:class 3 adenylate cyclase